MTPWLRDKHCFVGCLCRKLAHTFVFVLCITTLVNYVTLLYHHPTDLFVNIHQEWTMRNTNCWLHSLQLSAANLTHHLIALGIF